MEDPPKGAVAPPTALHDEPEEAEGALQAALKKLKKACRDPQWSGGAKGVVQGVLAALIEESGDPPVPPPEGDEEWLEPFGLEVRTEPECIKMGQKANLVIRNWRVGQ